MCRFSRLPFLLLLLLSTNYSLPSKAAENPSTLQLTPQGVQSMTPAERAVVDQQATTASPLKATDGTSNTSASPTSNPTDPAILKPTPAQIPPAEGLPPQKADPVSQHSQRAYYTTQFVAGVGGQVVGYALGWKLGCLEAPQGDMASEMGCVIGQQYGSALLGIAGSAAGVYTVGRLEKVNGGLGLTLLGSGLGALAAAELLTDMNGFDVDRPIRILVSTAAVGGAIGGYELSHVLRTRYLPGLKEMHTISYRVLPTVSPDATGLMIAGHF